MFKFEGCIICGTLNGTFYFTDGKGYCENCRDFNIKVKEPFICNNCLNKNTEELDIIYDNLYICYKSGQINEQQWQEHLEEDDKLRYYLKYKYDYEGV